jgi:TPR repeat protein
VVSQGGRSRDDRGPVYDAGQGVTQDAAQAALWYRKAADQGDVEAQFNLGELYREGRGVPLDLAQAAAWYRKAAEQDEANAQVRLGGLYFLGQGVPQDYAEADFWFGLALAGKPVVVTRDVVAQARTMATSHLNKDQLAQLQARTQKWLAAHPLQP